MGEEGFHHALEEFLFNGKCYRKDILPGLLDMLRLLRDVVRESDSFRFFTSSLLIIYDGAVMEDADTQGLVRGATATHGTSSTAPDSCTQPQSTVSGSNGLHNLQEMRKWVDVRMIDFARSTHHGMTNQSSYHGPDEGYIHGLTTLISVFESILGSV